MYQKVMVPLDGSKLAECALPYAEKLAKGCNAEEVILVSVTERVQVYKRVDDPGEPQGYRMIAESVGRKERQAERYLTKIAKRLEKEGIKVHTEVVLGEAAEGIASYAELGKCDIIVMASHGRSGPSRWAHGSVAEKVFRSSCVPLLMVRAPGCSSDIK